MTHSLAEALGLLTSGTISAVELTDDLIARSEAHADLNVFIPPTFDAARSASPAS